VFVDIAANAAVRAAVHHHFGDALRHSLMVGLTHGLAPSTAGLAGPEPVTFFAPAWIQQRARQWTPAGMQERLAAAWHAMARAMTARHALDPRLLDATIRGMDVRSLAGHRRARQIAIGLVVLAIVVVARWRWDELTATHVPYVDYDTQIYRQIAERPLGLDLLISSKAVFVPLVYRAAHDDPAVVVAIQAELAFAAWTILTATLVLALRRGWTRAIAIGVGIAFLFAPTRVGFTASLMPESVGDSLTALVIAGAIWTLRLRGRARVGAAIATGACGACWMLTRDTNIAVALVATGVAMIVGRGWRYRGAWLATALVVMLAAVALWSTGQAHDNLPYQFDWDRRFTPRTMYPMVDNLVMRAFPDIRDEVPAELRRFAEPTAQVWPLVQAGPDRRAVQDWLVAHGAATYTRWLVRHPLDRVAELIAARWRVLTSSNTPYMPGGWDRGGALRKITSRHVVLLILMAATPIWLRRPRGDVRCGLVLCILASGVVGAAASYYGDAAEVSRHCYGAGQQIVIGLFLALVVGLDRLERRGAAVVAAQAP
jgi:hypothetical protein